jgi:hypothetical protein
MANVHLDLVHHLLAHMKCMGYLLANFFNVNVILFNQLCTAPDFSRLVYVEGEGQECSVR